MSHRENISAEVPDWSREEKGIFEWVPSISLLKSIRRYQRVKSKPSLFGFLIKPVAIIQHRFWSIVTGADIPINCQIEGGLRMPHPNGIVIHPDAKIGPNCLIFQQVTIGSVEGALSSPVIGGHVDIGAGAKILGSVQLGNHSNVGANAVVLIDVPEGKTAVGVPAKII